MRLFIGVPIPPDPRLTQVTHALRGVAHDAKPVPPGTWHVTLRFLGEMADPRPAEEALHMAVAGHHAMPVEVKGLGAFQGPRRARIVWARVQADGLRELARAIVEATQGMGEPAKQDFVAHATLARLPHPMDVSAFLEARRDDVLSTGWLDRVVLYRSVLGPHGPMYRSIVGVPLASGPPA